MSNPNRKVSVIYINEIFTFTLKYIKGLYRRVEGKPERKKMTPYIAITSTMDSLAVLDKWLSYAIYVND